MSHHLCPSMPAQHLLRPLEQPPSLTFLPPRQRRTSRHARTAAATRKQGRRERLLALALVVLAHVAGAIAIARLDVSREAPAVEAVIQVALIQSPVATATLPGASATIAPAPDRTPTPRPPPVTTAPPAPKPPPQAMEPTPAKPLPAPARVAQRPDPVPAPVPAPVPRPAPAPKAAPVPNPTPEPKPDAAQNPVNKTATAVSSDAGATTPTPSLMATTPRESPSQAPTSAPSHGGPSTTRLVGARFDAAYLNNPPPSYPALSRRMREEGQVLLRVLVSADGRPATIELKQSSGSRRLDKAAETAVARWRFVPAKQDERAIQSWVIVPIVFKLEGR